MNPYSAVYWLYSGVIISMVVVIVALLMNIRLRYRAEQELKENRDFLNRILNATPNLVYVKDLAGRFQLVNRAFTQFFGRPEEKIISHQIEDLLDEPDEIHSILQSENEVLESDSSRFISAEKITSPVTGKTNYYQVLRVPIRVGLAAERRLLAVANDITHQRRVALELREERNFVDAVVNNAGALIVVMDREGRVLRFNRSCQQLTGYSFEEVENKKIWELLIPEDERPKVELVFKELIAGDFSNEHENHWRTRDGAKKLISWSNTAIPAKDGTVKYVVAIGIDITHQRGVENALRHSEEKYRTIFEHTGTALVIIDDDDVILDMNEEFARLCGCERSEVVGVKDWTEFVAPEDLSSMKEKHRRRKQEPDSVESEYEFKFIDSEGNKKDVYLTVDLIPDSRRVVASLLDITERKRMETELARSEKRFRTIVSNAPGIIFRCLNDDEWTMKFISKRIEELTGYCGQDILENKNISYASLIHPDDRQKVRDAFQSGQYSLSYRIKDIAGVTKWVQESGQVVSYQGCEQEYIDGIILDVTELKQTQEKLEASLREKETLLKETHHRVKNNLFVVVSLLEMQAMRGADSHAIDILQQSVDRIHSMALVHEKLYRSQSLEQIDFAPYLESLTEDLLVSYSYDDQVDIKIEAEDIALEIDQAIPAGLIVNELLSNSLQHAFDTNHGEIELIFERENNAGYRLFYSDSGKGLPPDLDLNDIDSLGLKLVSSLAENQLQGDFNIPNSAQGAAFEIRF